MPRKPIIVNDFPDDRPNGMIVDLNTNFSWGSSINSASDISSPPVPISEISVQENMTLIETLEVAATQIISQLTPSLRDYCLELADIILKIPRWQFVLGHVVAQYSSGNLTAPEVDPAWRDIQATTTNTPNLDKKEICCFCNKPFTPLRLRQKFCSGECGKAFNKAEIDASKRAKQERLNRSKEASGITLPIDATWI